MMLTKNQEWKQWKAEHGGDMSFREWRQMDLDNEVKQTANFVNADGDTTKVNPNDNYQPQLTHNTILGVNKWLVYGVLSVVVLGIGVAIVRNTGIGK